MLNARRGVPESSIPDYPIINNLNSLLQDIYLRYIALRDDDFEEYYNVMQNIWYQIHKKMKEVDKYFDKYSSTVQFAGSHPDKLRINKPDEFDIDIVVDMPLSIKEDPINPDESDIIIKPQDPGFVELEMGVQYDRIPKRFKKEWDKNYAVFNWKDDDNFLRGSKFMDWFKGVVDKALNQFNDYGTGPVFEVDGVEYTVGRSASGPATTLYIENELEDFKLDVDLVPALRFPIERWPICEGYESIPNFVQQKAKKTRRSSQKRNPAHYGASQPIIGFGIPQPVVAYCGIPQPVAAYNGTPQLMAAHYSSAKPKHIAAFSGTSQSKPVQKKPFYRRAKFKVSDFWMVVPKPNKSRDSKQERDRSWRIAMHEQERVLMHDTKNMRQAIRLIKKFRDAQNMSKITSYYIKTMFFWEARERGADKTFWHENPAYLFTYMLEKFHGYLVSKNLPYFWNIENNLIGDIDAATLKGYERTVKKLLDILKKSSDLKMVAEYMLTEDEFEEYNNLGYIT